jgi:hypothetical protein
MPGTLRHHLPGELGSRNISADIATHELDDVYGDGPIVVVPAPGHTPGSAIIFVTLSNGARYAFVGDLVWQLEGITLREQRSWLIRQFADLDAAGTRQNLMRMIAIKERLPDLIIVPAHDMRAFAGIPTHDWDPPLETKATSAQEHQFCAVRIRPALRGIPVIDPRQSLWRQCRPDTRRPSLGGMHVVAYNLLGKIVRAVLRHHRVGDDDAQAKCRRNHHGTHREPTASSLCRNSRPCLWSRDRNRSQYLVRRCAACRHHPSRLADGDQRGRTNSPSRPLQQPSWSRRCVTNSSFTSTWVAFSS